MITVQLLPGTTNHLTQLLNSEDWEHAIAQCQANPSEAGAWTERPGFFEGVKSSDVLPIHIACMLRPSVALIDALYEAKPETFRCKESAYQRSALHIASQRGASTDVILRLIQYYPQAAGVADTLGRLPLHYLLSNGANDVACDALLKACPGGAQAYDHRRWLPLHVAASAGASFCVCKALVEAYPEAVLLTTKKKSTPRDLIRMAPLTEDTEKVKTILVQKEREQRDKIPRKAAKPNRGSVRVVV